MLYKIRRVRLDDLDVLAKIYMSAYAAEPWCEPDWKYEQALERINDLFSSPNSFCFTYEECGVVKGAFLCKLLSWYDGKKVEAHELFVDSTHQRKGIAGLLFKHVETEGIIAGANEISFWTLRIPESEWLLNYYKKLGYEIPDDRVVMIKELKA